MSCEGGVSAGVLQCRMRSVEPTLRGSALRGSRHRELLCSQALSTRPPLRCKSCLWTPVRILRCTSTATEYEIGPAPSQVPSSRLRPVAAHRRRSLAASPPAPPPGSAHPPGRPTPYSLSRPQPQTKTDKKTTSLRFIKGTTAVITRKQTHKQKPASQEKNRAADPVLSPRLRKIKVSTGIICEKRSKKWGRRNRAQPPASAAGESDLYTDSAGGGEGIARNDG